MNFCCINKCLSTLANLIKKRVGTLNVIMRTWAHRTSSFNLMSFWCYLSLDVYNMNPVVHLEIRLIIRPSFGLVHKSADIELDFLYLITGILFFRWIFWKTAKNIDFLTLGVIILVSKKKLVLSFQCNVVAQVWSDKASMWRRVVLVLLAEFYILIIYPSLESETTAGCICTFQNSETLRRVWIIPKTYPLLLIILAHSTSSWHSIQLWVV